MSKFPLGDRGSNPTSSHQIKFVEVNSKEKRDLFVEITKTYHKYKPKSSYVGRQLNYIIYLNDEPIGTIGIGSPILLLTTRDEYIGWGKGKSLRKDLKNPNLKKIANNWRFCLKPDLPKNIGSQVLSILVHKAKNEWVKKYNGERLVLLETIVAPPFNGTVYLAAGWVYIGETSGFESNHENQIEKDEFGRNKFKGKMAIAIYTGVKKKIFIKPLCSNWKQILMSENIPHQ